MIESMIRSYILAFILVAGLMVLLLGSFRVGLVSMIPNLTPILFTLGFMGWANIKLDLFTLLIGSIALGVAVDDTIHFMHNFRRYSDETGDVRKAVRKTMETTGQAMLFTSIVLSFGFFLYMYAGMMNLRVFGFLTGATILLAFVADVVIAPALMALVAKKKDVETP